MGLLARRKVETEPGRAAVMPQATGPANRNSNQFAGSGSVGCSTLLEPLTAEGRGPMQRVRATMPNWLWIVLFHVGSNDDIGPQLPREADIPVLMEKGTTRIVSVDVDGAAAELEQYRELGLRHWKETDSPLAPLRAVRALPGTAMRLARGVPAELADLRDDVRGLFESGPPSGPPKQHVGPKEREQLHRTALQQRVFFARNPKERAKARAAAQQAIPHMVSELKAGYRHPADTDAWIMQQEVAELLSAEEAAEARRQAGLEG